MNVENTPIIIDQDISSHGKQMTAKERILSSKKYEDAKAEKPGSRKRIRECETMNTQRCRANGNYRKTELDQKRKRGKQEK